MSGYRAVDPRTLKQHPRNPRRRVTLDSIQEGIRRYGFYNTIVVQESTGFVLAGNHRIQAAIAEGLDTVPAHFLDVDDEQAMRIVLVDNRTADKGGYEDTALLNLLERLESLEGTGYTGDDLDDLLVRIEGELIAPEQPFTGDYAETPEEQAQRRAMGGDTRQSNGLTDVVLAYNLNDFATFDAVVRGIRREHKGMTTGQAVIHMLATVIG